MGRKIKVTKRPKRITVTYTKTEETYSEYECPSCGLYLIGAAIGLHVTRFRCKCGQELIVDKRVIKKEEAK